MPLFNNRIASPLVGEAEFQHEERVLEIQVRGNLRTSCIFRPLTRICSSLRSHNCGLSPSLCYGSRLTQLVPRWFALLLKGRGYSYVGSLYSSRGEGVSGTLLRRQYDYYVALRLSDNDKSYHPPLKFLLNFIHKTLKSCNLL